MTTAVLAREQVGRCAGKAAVLNELRLAGFPVPEFVVSTGDYCDAVAALGFPVAVRSSASLEDGAAVSFAGQFRSFLNLGTADEIRHAEQQCRESVKSPAVVEYCRRNGIDHSALKMDVIVQRMIEPELSGVAFTVNPVTGAPDVVIEACEGLADELLAGRGGALPAEHPLMRRYARRITELARSVERHFGAPQDVEFAIQDGALYLLQARPITRIAFASEPGEWTNADFRDGGVSSGVCSPLMWSLYEFIWERALKGCLRELHLWDGDFRAARLFFGRPYWNLGAVKRCLAKLPGFVEREFDRDLSVASNYEGRGTCTAVTLRGVLRALPALFAVRSFLRAQESFDRRFLAGGFDAIERQFDPNRPDVEAALGQLVETAYAVTETNYFRTIFAASLAKLDFMSSFADADYASLVAALPKLRHMAPVRAARRMAATGQWDARLLVSRYRHHSRFGLDVRFPRWDEDDEFVASLLRAVAPPARRDSRLDYASAQAEALARLRFWKRPGFRRKLDRLRTFVWLREEMRDLSSRVYYLIRRYVLEIARRRAIGDDIFFMTFREILADDRSNIERNRDVFERYRHFRAPNEIGCRFRSDDRTPAAGLCGIGASRGTARGVARVACSVEAVSRLEAGVILICPFTDPGWTPVLARAAAVVTETGGLLSHAAVICREFGIPAVLGVPAATQRIHDGSFIAVHGGEGYVELLN